MHLLPMLVSWAQGPQLSPQLQTKTLTPSTTKSSPLFFENFEEKLVLLLWFFRATHHQSSHTNSQKTVSGRF